MRLNPNLKSQTKFLSVVVNLKKETLNAFCITQQLVNGQAILIYQQGNLQ
jgi:hypothetical protein